MRRNAALLFTRKTLIVEHESSTPTRISPLPQEETKLPTLFDISEKEINVLVLNSSTEMAKEITLQLTLGIPGCSILYAPTISLAKVILTKREIDLVVSSPVLPDGNVSRLRDALTQMKKRPDLVVVGDISTRNAQVFEYSGYEFTGIRRFGEKKEHKNESVPLVTQKAPPQKADLSLAIKNVGADLRNDLNNPLQEIVAMVFVAQSGKGEPSVTNQALDAIGRAAKNMAVVVKEIENKISLAVGES